MKNTIFTKNKIKIIVAKLAKGFKTFNTKKTIRKNTVDINYAKRYGILYLTKD